MADGVDATLHQLLFQQQQKNNKRHQQHQHRGQQATNKQPLTYPEFVMHTLWQGLTWLGSSRGESASFSAADAIATAAAPWPLHQHCSGSSGAQSSGSGPCARARLAHLSRQALQNYGADAEDEIFRLYAQMDAMQDASVLESGDCLRSTYAILGGKLYFRPRIEERDLYLRKGSLVRPVENVTIAEMVQMSTSGVALIDVFSALKTYQNFTGRPCMAMHHLGGYKGPTKRVVGMLLNDGNDFVMAVNPVVNGRSEERQRTRYRSTLCGRVFEGVDKHYAVGLNYVRFESLFYNVPQ
jgi:hypothetical protein